MSKIIVLANQKGGIGKSSCTRELGIYLSSLGKQVCLVDTDPQANLTKSLIDNSSSGLFEALTGKEWVLEQINDKLSILPGSISCAGLERSLVAEIDCYTRIKDLLCDKSFEKFDYILIDSPPSLSVMTINALTASDYLLIPMKPSQYCMQGTNDLISTVSKVKKTLNPELKIAGVIINEFERNPVIVREITKEIEEAFGNCVFSTRISKAIAFEEVISTKRGIIERKNRSSEEIRLIGDELISRIENGLSYAV